MLYINAHKYGQLALFYIYYMNYYVCKYSITIFKIDKVSLI